MWAAAEREAARDLHPAEWSAQFLPHWHTYAPADFHRILDGDLHQLHLTRGQKRAYLAPRGGAKSTWVTFEYTLRAAVEGWEPYILILSDSADQAAKFLSDLRGEIEGNTFLGSVYPDGAGPGGEWREGACRLRNGVLIESLGRGAKIRGRRNRRHRPSLVVIDDVQSNKDITSPTERTRAWDWLTREVIPAGDERTNILSVGTALHRDAIAVRVGQLPGWRLRKFQAIHAWPKRMDLWDQWERLATNLADDRRAETAAAFLADQRAEMEGGCRVYWPEKWPIESLMARLAEIGWNAFQTEYQQEPQAFEGCEWPPEYFDDAPGKPFWFDSWDGLPIVLKAQALDPSKGSTARPGDYQAHVVVGLAKDGTLYVEFDMRREPVPEMIRRAMDMAGGAWGPVAELVIEDNGTMGFLRPEVERAQAGRGLLPWRTVTQSEPKDQRIRCLGPYLSRGVNDGGSQRQIRVRNTPAGRIAIDQFKDFPLGDHDDGPDALSTAVKRLEQLVAGRV